MPKFIDLTGQTIGYLTVIKRIETKNSKTRWLCRCKCGNYATPITHYLLHHKDIPSCGCRRFEPEKMLGTTKHGLYKTRLYSIWQSMKKRCNNPSDSRFHAYGGSGITVCDEWNNDFVSFYDWSIENGYAPNLSIDRIDNSKGYYPENCRWITMDEQAKNKTTNVFIEHNGETKTLKDWCDLYNVRPSSAYQRRRKLIAKGETNITLDKLLYPENLNKHPILQYSTDGSLVKEWESIAEASRHGFERTCIYKCLKGKAQMHNGFIWKYKEQDADAFRLPEPSQF